MMKTLTFAAALMLGTAAFAQTTPQSTMPQSGTTTPDTMGTTTGTTTGTMQTPPADAGTMPSTTGTMGTTDNSATMPAPTATGTPMAAGTYPRCSRTVVDQCVQGPGRERDTRRSRRRG